MIFRLNAFRMLLLGAAGLGAWMSARPELLLARQFASGVNLVEVYATVTDTRGTLITGLASADFQVAEDGEPQAVTTFAAGEFPLAAAIAIDRSFSMSGKQLALAKYAARAFVGALRPEDQATIMAVGSEVETVAPPSSDRAAARAAIDSLELWGTTPLYDATIAALDAIKSGKGRRALVLLSDGVDRHSHADATEVVDQARRTGVLIYPVAIGGLRPPIFAELASVTGGRSPAAKDVRDIDAAVASITLELRHQYLLGYVPNRPASEQAQWRSIQVTIPSRPSVRVRARDGYSSR